MSSCTCIVLQVSFCDCHTGLANMGGTFPHCFSNTHEQVIYRYSQTDSAQNLVPIPGSLGNADSERSLHIENTTSRSGEKGIAICTTMDERRAHFFTFRLQHLPYFRKFWLTGSDAIHICIQKSLVVATVESVPLPTPGVGSHTCITDSTAWHSKWLQPKWHVTKREYFLHKSR